MTETLVNTYTSNYQTSPSVAVDADGDFVVAWQSNAQDGDGYGIYAQLYNELGVAVGSEFRVNTTTASNQSAPSVAVDADGDFVVAWQSYGQDGDGYGYGIYAQLYNELGVAVGSEFRVNTTTASNQSAPSVAVDADGDFVVAWQSYGQDGDGYGYGIYAQLYNELGVAVGSEFRVNTTTASNQSAPSVAVDADGDFVVAWQSSGQDGSSFGVYTDINPTCFLRGTLILTSRGEVPAEALRAGDLVATRFGGLRPIRWIGTQSFHPRFAGPTSTPIRFAPGSLGHGMPATDLFVSPAHAMLVAGAPNDELLAHAGALVNGITITQPAFQGDSIDYFHLDLGPHDCVLANGAWAETYFEDHNRNSFHNAADFHARFPGHQPHRQESCLPIVTEEHPEIDAIRQRLGPSLPIIAAPHLLADGTPVMLQQEDEGTWHATIPAGVRELRLVCRSACPAKLGISTDQRRLGFVVGRLELNGHAVPLHILAQGWHGLEHDGAQAWRWTDGNALLPHLAATQDTRLVLHGWWHPAVRGGAEAGQRVAA